MPLVPCRLSHVMIEEQTDRQTVYLSEIDGDRRLPIWIGPMEALAIDRAVKSQVFERPLTHDLLSNIIKATHHACREIRVTDLRGGTFYAELVLQHDQTGEEHIIDCRPSDALALLVRVPDTPLYVEDVVLREAAM